jgi:hypothetical protein
MFPAQLSVRCRGLTVNGSQCQCKGYIAVFANLGSNTFCRTCAHPEDMHEAAHSGMGYTQRSIIMSAYNKGMQSSAPSRAEAAKGFRQPNPEAILAKVCYSFYLTCGQKTYAYHKA